MRAVARAHAGRFAMQLDPRDKVLVRVLFGDSPTATARRRPFTKHSHRKSQPANPLRRRRGGGSAPNPPDAPECAPPHGSLCQSIRGHTPKSRS